MCRLKKLFTVTFSGKCRSLDRVKKIMANVNKCQSKNSTFDQPRVKGKFVKKEKKKK